jgi:hypothetical protein
MLHNFISLDFLKSIHARDIRFGWTDYFLLNQLWKSTNIVTVPLWLGGCITCSLRRAGDGIRLIGWMYLIPLAMFFVARGRDYYRAPAYPMLFAGGALGGEKWVETLPATRADAVHGTTWQAMAIAGALTAAILLPIPPPPILSGGESRTIYRGISIMNSAGEK